MRRLLFAVLLIVTAPLRAEDLLDIYHRAQERDPAWAAARANHAAGIERLPQGRAGLLPSVGLSAERTENDQQVVTPGLDTSQRFSAESYALTLTQPLYRVQNLAGYRQGQAEAQRAEFELAAARQDLILRVADAYFAVLTAQDVHAFARSEKESAKRLLALTRRQFSVGAATLVDVHEAQAGYDITVAQEIAAANELEVRREALRVLIGEVPTTLTGLGARLPLEAPQPSAMESWARSSLNNPAILTQEQAVESARQELEKGRAGHYPTLDLTAGRTFSDSVSPFSGARLETTNNQVGLLLAVPLYQGGGVSSRVRELAARYDEARQQLEALKRQTAQQARTQYLAVINGIARITALEQALVSNRRALETTLLGYERGQRNGVDVLNTQRQLYATRRDLTTARYDYLNNRLRLLAAAGTLDEAEIEAINRQLGEGPAAADGNP